MTDPFTRNVELEWDATGSVEATPFLKGNPQFKTGRATKSSFTIRGSLDRRPARFAVRWPGTAFFFYSANLKSKAVPSHRTPERVRLSGRPSAPAKIPVPLRPATFLPRIMKRDLGQESRRCLREHARPQWIEPALQTRTRPGLRRRGGWREDGLCRYGMELGRGWLRHFAEMPQTSAERIAHGRSRCADPFAREVSLRSGQRRQQLVSDYLAADRWLPVDTTATWGTPHRCVWTVTVASPIR